MMSGIRGKNTKPEMIVRRLLSARGLRYRIHYKDAPGHPDVAFPAKKIAILIHGCFWHAHGCSVFKWPKSNVEFWKEKLSGNVSRDERKRAALLSGGWRVIVIWECALRSASDTALLKLSGQLQSFLLSSKRSVQLPSSGARKK